MSAFIGTAQQIFGDVYGLGALFPAAFATVAGVMAVSALLNARLLSRFSMRTLGHGALIGFTLVSAAHGAAILAFGAPPFWLYLLLLCLSTLCFGLIGANFNAIAMEPLGARAGAGAAFFGFATTALSAALGALVARQFDGTPAPFILGQAGLGVAALLAVWATERGRLFGARRSG